MISPEQIRAARGLLFWSQKELATVSGVSLNTINKIESGESITFGKLSKIRNSLENMSIEFLGRAGVTRHSNETKIYEGPNSCDLFYGDMLATAKEKGGEIVAVHKTPEMLARSLGVANFANLERVENLRKYANIKCLVSDAQNSSLPIPSIQFRAVPRHPTGVWSTFTCGDKHAIVITKDGAEFTFFVMKSVDISLVERKDFTSHWNASLPLVIQAAQNKC